MATATGHGTAVTLCARKMTDICTACHLALIKAIKAYRAQCTACVHQTALRNDSCSAYAYLARPAVVLTLAD
jgi:hypothetical protein